MEEVKKEDGRHPEGCECFMCKHKGLHKGGLWCGHGSFGNYVLVRIILILLILAFVFFAGFWFGNMASLFRHGGYGDGYGYGMMRGGFQQYNYRNLDTQDYQGYGAGRGMMRGGFLNAPNSTSSGSQAQ